MRWFRVSSAVLITLAILVSVLTGCSVVAGDSLVVNAAVSDGAPVGPYFTAESNVDGVVLQGFSGGAPCDYVHVRQAAWDKYHPSKISFAWSGNNLTSCMLDRYGNKLTGLALRFKYQVDLTSMTKWWAAKGTKVIYSAPLCTAPGSTVPNGDPAFRMMELGLASRFAAQGYHVAYSEYAATQICPEWQYYSPYRSVDGLHLSQTGAAIYASALRYESKHTVIP